jgi:hypothetical protein
MAAALLTALAACSSPPTGGTAGATTGTTTSSIASSDGSLPGYGAPKVKNPLDTSKWQKNACSVLTAAQLASVGLQATGKDQSNATGPGCGWSQPTDLTKPSIGVAFVTANTSGLTTLFKKHQEPNGMAILNTLPDINGFPAVIYSNDPGSIQDGICTVAVGVTDQLDVTMQANISSGPNKQHACDIAMQVAKAAMDTMTGGS